MTTHPSTHHGIPFRTSTHSTSDCVAVAPAPATVAVADTKTRHAEVVEVAPDAWAAFIAHVRG
jgi:hypothetical protein